MKGELKKYITKIYKIPDQLLDEFLSHRHIKTGSWKEIITAVDAVERYLYFTVKGFQKAYYIKDDKDFNIAFTYPFAFNCVPESFLTQKPSNYSFECLTDSEFLRISYEDFFCLCWRWVRLKTLRNLIS